MENIFKKEDLHINITSKLVFHNPIVSIVIINFIIFESMSKDLPVQKWIYIKLTNVTYFI